MSIQGALASAVQEDSAPLLRAHYLRRRHRAGEFPSWRKTCWMARWIQMSSSRPQMVGH